MQVFIGFTTDLTDLTDEKGEWVGEMGAHTERNFGHTESTESTERRIASDSLFEVASLKIIKKLISKIIKT